MTLTFPLTRGFRVLIDDEDLPLVLGRKWFAMKSPHTVYAASTRRQDSKPQLLLMHRVILNAPHNRQVDHLNGNGLDNRRCNIRICEPSVNVQNTKKNNKYGFRGIKFRKDRGLFRAEVKLHGDVSRSPWFPTAIEAATAYDEIVLRIYGEISLRNFGGIQR